LGWVQQVEKQLQNRATLHLAERTALDAKEIIGKLEHSIVIWPPTLCLEASDLQKPGFGVHCLHRWAKEGETRVRETTLVPISFLPTTSGKSYPENANHD